MPFMIDSMRQDLGYAIRQLRLSPGFTAAAIGCLALGVWLACVVTAVGRGFYRPDLGVPRADRLVQVDFPNVFGMDYHGRLISRSVLDGLREARTFAAIGEYQGLGFRLAGDPKQRSGVRLSSGMFSVLGIRPHIGRAFVPDEDNPGSGNVAILSYDFWQRQFGGDSAVIGRELDLHEGSSHTIVGVMPRGFNFPHLVSREIYVAAGSTISRFPYFNTVRAMLARMHDGGTVEQAEAAARELAVRNIVADHEELVAAWASQGSRHRPRSPSPLTVRAARYYAEPIDSSGDRLIALIIGCGICVVLVACANVANLLLVRGATRRQEIAVRMALGASRGRIVTQLLAESILLSVAGAAVGFLLAFWHWQMLDGSFAFRGLFGRIDRHVALTAAILGIALVAVFGLLPALRSSSMRIEQVLRDVRRSGMGVTKLDGLLARLVVASTAGTVVLLASAALLGLSAHDLMSRRKFSTKDVVAADVLFKRGLAPREIARQAQLALERLATRPGVRWAAIAPLPGSSGRGLMRVTPAGSTVIDLPDADVRSITSGYFSTIGVPLIAGRMFTPHESVDSVGLVILGAALAERLWPGQSAVGKVARFAAPGDHVGTLATVVGVAADVTLKGNGQPSTEIYFPFGLRPSRATTALVRYEGTAIQQITAALRMGVRESGMLAGEAMSLEQRERQTDLGRYVYIGFAMFSGAGLILVTIGLYGVIAFSVARRTHEIGVRLALGAEGRDVGLMVVRQGLRMTLVGTAIGLVLALGSTRVLQGVVPDLSAADVRILLVVIGVVITVSLVACYLPGRHAAKLDPMNALRAE